MKKLLSPKIKTVGVVGAGQMGSGIAQVAASSGFFVIVNDVEDRYVVSCLGAIERRLERMVEKQEITDLDQKAILGRLHGSTSLRDMAKVDFIIETIIEDEGVKRQVFKELDEYCRKEVVLASNTSSISITKVASATKRPDKVIGMHFMNPVPMFKIVEVTVGLATSQEAVQVTKDIAAKMGKSVLVVKDSPGFILNRISMPMINEAIFALFESIGKAEDIDQMMRLGLRHPIGPLALADFIGLDTCLRIMEVLHREFGDDKYRPCPLLRKYVDAGWLGKKTGKGFYEY